MTSRTAPGILDRECIGDSELRQRVEAVLKVHDQFNDFVNEPLVGPNGRGSAVLRGFRHPAIGHDRLTASVRRAGEG